MVIDENNKVGGLPLGTKLWFRLVCFLVVRRFLFYGASNWYDRTRFIRTTPSGQFPYYPVLRIHVADKEEKGSIPRWKQ